jgi:hypothetical protein
MSGSKQRICETASTDRESVVKHHMRPKCVTTACQVTLMRCSGQPHQVVRMQAPCVPDATAAKSVAFQQHHRRHTLLHGPEVPQLAGYGTLLSGIHNFCKTSLKYQAVTTPVGSGSPLCCITYRWLWVGILQVLIAHQRLLDRHNARVSC